MHQPLFTRQTVAASAVCLGVMLVALYFEGRPWWCKYGFGLVTWVRTHCTSQQLLDPYSLSHVLHGVIFYWMLRPWGARISLSWRMVAGLALEIGWEILENTPWVIDRYRQATIAFDYSGDSVLNALGDVLSSASGFAFAARAPWKASVALFVAFELFLLAIARDNLTLNVLMLGFPIEAIKQWQSLP